MPSDVSSQAHVVTAPQLSQRYFRISSNSFRQRTFECGHVLIRTYLKIEGGEWIRFALVFRNWILDFFATRVGEFIAGADRLCEYSGLGSLSRSPFAHIFVLISTLVEARLRRREVPLLAHFAVTAFPNPSQTAMTSGLRGIARRTLAMICSRSMSVRLAMSNR